MYKNIKKHKIPKNWKKSSKMQKIKIHKIINEKKIFFLLLIKREREN